MKHEIQEKNLPLIGFYLIVIPILDIRTQLNEQLRCLDSRLECQQSQLVEIQVREKLDRFQFNKA